jgi:hypothetical protein
MRRAYAWLCVFVVVQLRATFVSFQNVDVLGTMAPLVLIVVLILVVFAAMFKQRLVYTQANLLTCIEDMKGRLSQASPLPRKKAIEDIFDNYERTKAGGNVVAALLQGWFVVKTVAYGLPVNAENWIDILFEGASYVIMCNYLRRTVPFDPDSREDLFEDRVVNAQHSIALLADDKFASGSDEAPLEEVSPAADDEVSPAVIDPPDEPPQISLDEVVYSNASRFHSLLNDDRLDSIKS